MRVRAQPIGFPLYCWVQHRLWHQALFAQVWVWRCTSVMLVCVTLRAVQDKVAQIQTLEWVRSGYAEGITNRWLLVPLIPYTVKQAFLENSHSNMSILRRELESRVVQPSDPPSTPHPKSLRSSPPPSLTAPPVVVGALDKTAGYCLLKYTGWHLLSFCCTLL